MEGGKRLRAKTDNRVEKGEKGNRKWEVTLSSDNKMMKTFWHSVIVK